MPILEDAAKVELTIKPYLDLRVRYERRTDRDFAYDASDNRSDLLSRMRVGTILTYGKRLSGVLEYQYAHDWVGTCPLTFSTWNSDVSQANLTYKFDGGSVTAGRYKLRLGSQRLIGPLDWNNVSRSFDGASASSGSWQAFVAKIGLARPVPRNVRLAGATYGDKYGQVNVIYKHDGDGNRENVTTLNPWFHRPFGDWKVDLEGAAQVGRVRGRDQRAFAGHAQVSYSASDKTEVYVTGNAASGGGSSNVRKTFDTLYPSSHNIYGLLDMVGWQNSREIAVGVNHDLRSNLTLRGSFHRFWLDSARDAWYNARGGVNSGSQGDFVDPSGKSGRDLGSELDFEAVYGWRKNATLCGGIGTFLPGKFVRSFGGANEREVFGYVQMQFRF